MLGENGSALIENFAQDGRIFYFLPGHETNPSLRNEYVQRIIRNAVHWCCPSNRKIELTCPKADPVEQC